MAVDILENGRGPKTEATGRLASDGSLASLHAVGHHTMGAKVDESFERVGDHARWKSAEEQGERDVHGTAFFLPIADLPQSFDLLIGALAKAGGKLALLPGGEARMERTGEATVRVGGVDKHLVSVAITGLDLLPQHAWLDDDGSFYAITSPWFSMVPEGAESIIDPLIEKQNGLDRARDARVAAESAKRPAKAGLAFTHARVLDVERGKWLADQTVVVVGETITAVGPSPSVKVPSGAEVVDAAGKALVPGFWDMHAHLDDSSGALDIAAGVTTARDVGNDPDKLDDWKKRFDEGSAVGPHVLRMGFIEGRNEKAASSKITAETPEEARAAVGFYEKRGYDGVKIYNSVKPELVPLITKEAHGKGMLVTGHVPVHMLAHEAVDAGYDGIEHINMLFLNFFATHETDTRDTTRFTLVGDKAADFDLASKPVSDFIAQLAKKHVVIDPTLDAFEDLLVGEQGKITPGLEALVGRLPVQSARGFLTGGLPSDGAKSARYKASYDKLLAMVKLLSTRNVPVVIGTDATAGLFFHHELALFARAGVPNATILRMATIDAARAMKLDKKTGTIAVGKRADLALIDGDPLARIGDAERVVTTVRGGVVYAPEPLFRSVGVKPALAGGGS
jgi:imidazolonepropionase-like amidohydrolase